MVCFGDSITGPEPRLPYLHQYVKYPDVLQAMLEARLGSGMAVVINRGWAGDRTYPDPTGTAKGAVERLNEDLLNERPDLATVLISGNDANQPDHDPARSLANLRKIFAAAKQAEIRTLAMQYHVLPNPAHPDRAWKKLADNNQAIAVVAAENGFPVLDMQAPMLAASRVHPLGELVNLEDGVHLAPRGELVYAKAIFEKLKTLGWLES